MSGSAIPEQLRDLPSQAIVQDSIARARLVSAGLLTIGDLAGLTFEDLLNIDGIGVKTAQAVRSALNAIARGADPTTSPPATIEEELKALVRQAPGRNRDRNLSIVTAYRGLDGGEPQTLEAIAVRLSLTRERVRQLLEKTEIHVGSAFDWYPSAVLPVVRQALHRQSGLMRLADLVAAVAEAVPPGDTSCERYIEWLAVLRQVHVDEATRLVFGPPFTDTHFREATAIVSHAIRAANGLRADDLMLLLQHVLPEATHDVLREHAALLVASLGTEVLPGLFSATPWTRADWAVFVLESVGKPLHFTHIANAASALSLTDFDARSFDSLLNRDERFVRVGSGDFALAAWGAMRYTRFDEVVDHYLRNAPHCVHESTICRDLGETYTVVPATILGMMRTPWSRERLRHFGGGYWGTIDRHYAEEDILVSEITHVLDKSGVATAADIARRVVARRRIPGVTAEDVTRALYVCPNFSARGTSPVRFTTTDLRRRIEQEARAMVRGRSHGADSSI